jgi:hypothetical protein
VRGPALTRRARGEPSCAWEVERVGDVVVLDVRAEGEGLAALRAMFG